MGKLEFKITGTETMPIENIRFQVGQAVRCSMGSFGDLVDLFDGDIVKLSPSFGVDKPSYLTVVCYDRGYKMRRDNAPAIFKEASHKGIATTITKQHGLGLLVNPPEKLASFKLEDDQAVVQTDETDWQVLAGMAKSGNYNLVVHGNTVYLVDDKYMAGTAFHEALRPGSKRHNFTFHYRPDPINIEDADSYPLVSFNPNVGTAGQRQQVEVKSWAAVGEAGERFGKGKLTQTPTRGTKYTEIVIATETIETLRITNKAARTAAQAKYLAKAEMARRAARLVEGEVVLGFGVAHLRMGLTVNLAVHDLQPFGAMFSGPYLIEAVRHEIDTDGNYTSAFDVRRDGVTTK
jgi:hypothetical protein